MREGCDLDTAVAAAASGDLVGHLGKAVPRVFWTAGSIPASSLHRASWRSGRRGDQAVEAAVAIADVGNGKQQARSSKAQQPRYRTSQADRQWSHRDGRQPGAGCHHSGLPRPTLAAAEAAAATSRLCDYASHDLRGGGRDGRTSALDLVIQYLQLRPVTGFVRRAVCSRGGEGLSGFGCVSLSTPLELGDSRLTVVEDGLLFDTVSHQHMQVLVAICAASC
ncbi:hypothetical protein VTI74DRAFT_4831 [Chaetomium olivicolor]